MTRSTRGVRRRLDDLDAIREALDRVDPIRLLLSREGALSSEARELVERARALGVPIVVESAREMRRMATGEGSLELLAVAGAPAPASLDELMSAAGLVFLLVDLRYPANVGFILRSAEVAGVAGVVLANDWRGSERAEASRVGMRAERFLPIIESGAEAAIAAARRAGRRVVAFETGGGRAPWEIDFRSPSVVVVGGETSGIPASVLAEADDLVRIPTRGIIPSYNVQAAVSIALGEWLRQGGVDG